MQIEATPAGALLIIAIMALVTLATRWGGVMLMSFIPIGDRVKRFIQAMSASVLVAIIAPLAVTGGDAARVALAATAVTMLVFRRPLPAIAAGVLAAALMRLG